MHNPNMIARSLTLIAVVGALGSPSWAKDYKKITLSFRPQETVSATTVTLAGSVSQRPIGFGMSENRKTPDPLQVGAQLDDGEESYKWLSTGPVLPAVSGFVTGVLREWFVILDDGAPLRLNLELIHYFVTETEQFVGSTYAADVAIRASLRDAEHQELWTGNVRGESHRFGQDESADNCNEVLSDALKSALANLLQDQGLLSAWSSGKTAQIPQTSAVSPDRLLEDLVRLKDAGVGVEVMTGLAEQSTLSAPLTADDILKWKAKEIPEPVIAVVLRKHTAQPADK